MDCILNELSVRPVATWDEANQVLEKFVNCIRIAQEVGVKQIRLSPDLGGNLFHIMLTNNYSIGTWLNDDRIDRELRERFRLISTTSPFLTEQELIEIDERSIFRISNYSKEHEAKGFGAAHIMQIPLVSLLTDEVWNTNQLTGYFWSFNELDQEITEDISVIHFARPEHLESHKIWILEQLANSLRTSLELWERQAEFFPHLVLCGEVKRQLTRIGFSKSLPQIIEKLRVLDQYVADWHEGHSFDLNQLRLQTNLDVSGESESTMNKYDYQRRFKLYTGRYEYFELHIKAGNLRFHFYPDDVERRIYVGYIGPHLDTVTG